MTAPRTLPAHRPLVTQKMKIVGRRTVYISVHDDERLGEIFLRMSSPDLTPELIAAYDTIALLSSLACNRAHRWPVWARYYLGTQSEAGRAG